MDDTRMTGPAPGTRSPSAGALDERLRSVMSRLRWVSRGERTGAAVWPIPTALLAVLLIDASLALPGVVRAGIGVALLVLAARVVTGLIPSREARRVRAERAARMIEERAGVAGNALINALQLRPVAVGEGVTGELARRAVAFGESRAREVVIGGVVDAGGAKRSWGRALMALAVFGAAWLAAPRLFAMGLPRVVDPFGDHPAFTLTDFEVSWEPARVLAGDDVTVRVRLAGRVPSAVDIVQVDPRGVAVDRAAMIAQGGVSARGRANEYAAVVREVRAPIRFRIEGDTGASRSWVIEPEMRPRIESMELRVRPPAYTGMDEVVYTGTMMSSERGAIGVLVGSTVVLRARTTMDLEGVGQEGSTIRAGAGVSGRDAVQETRFDAPGERTLSLRPVGVGGLACEDAATARVLVVEDGPPAVRIEEPARRGEVFVMEGAAFPVSGVATDDVAVARFGVRWRVLHGDAEKSAEERAFPLEAGRGARRSADGRAVISVADLGAGPGDRIEVTIEGWDARGDAFGGAQRGVSETITVRVIDREEFARRFAEEMTAQSVTRPYEELARSAERLDERAQDLRAEARELARDVQRLGTDEAIPEAMRRSVEALEQRVESFGAERDRLAEEVRRRLELPDAVEFDEKMREPMERLLERLEAMDAPEMPGLGDRGDREANDEGAQGGEEDGEKGESDTPPDKGASDDARPDQRLDRARVGRWLKDLNEAVEGDAQEAALASDEAALDMVRPAAALELADKLQRTLEQVDDAARRQRMLADRLSAMTEADATAREELASRQEAIQAQLEQAVRDLRTLGDRAAHELGSKESPSGLARSVLDERAGVQRAIDGVGDAAARLPDDLAGQSVRSLVEKSVELVMDEVYRQTAPIADALSSAGSMPARDDEPGAEALAPIVEEIERALQVLEQIEAYLDEAGASFEETGGGSVAARSVVDVIAMSVIGVSPMEISGGANEDIRRAIEEARFRIQRLRATLRQAETGLTPLLPKMGGSAMGLGESVAASDAAPMMEGAASLLRGGDLMAATERAIAAAEALEALYEEPGEGPPGEPGAPDLDQEMKLSKPGDPRPQDSPSSGSSGSSSGESPSGGGQGKPSTLDQLKQNRQRGGEQGEEAKPGEQTSDADAPGLRPGETPGPSDAGDGAGRAGSPSAPGEDAQRGEEGARERSRFFNEMLYEEAPESMREVNGAVVEGAAGEPGVGAASSRAGGSDSAGVSVPRGLTGPGAAAFVHVPEAYKDVVAAYFERIARDAEQSGGR